MILGNEAFPLLHGGAGEVKLFLTVRTALMHCLSLQHSYQKQEDEKGARRESFFFQEPGQIGLLHRGALCYLDKKILHQMAYWTSTQT